MLSIFARTVVVTGVTMLLLAASPHVASAVNFFGDACQGSGSDAAACSGNGDTITGTDGVILRAAALLSIVAGVAAVIGIIIAAVMFITSDGDSNKISTAKKMIIYIVIGMITILLSRAIVIFVVKNV